MYVLCWLKVYGVFVEQRQLVREDTNCEEPFLEIKLIGNLISSNQAFARFHLYFVMF